MLRNYWFQIRLLGGGTSIMQSDLSSLGGGGGSSFASLDLNFAICHFEKVLLLLLFILFLLRFFFLPGGGGRANWLTEEEEEGPPSTPDWRGHQIGPTSNPYVHPAV